MSLWAHGMDGTNAYTNSQSTVYPTLYAIDSLSNPCPCMRRQPVASRACSHHSASCSAVTAAYLANQWHTNTRFMFVTALSAPRQVQAALLSLYVRHSAGAPSTLMVLGVGSGWSERSITWATAPRPVTPRRSAI